MLAHNISLINVRAGVALHLVDERPDAIDPDQVRPALAAIKDASKDALGELRPEPVAIVRRSHRRRRLQRDSDALDIGRTALAGR